MSLSRQGLVALFRAVTDGIFRVHAEALADIPTHGPLILVMNHVNLWEVPLIYARLQPRPVHGLVLADRWKNPLLAWGLNVCGAIPLKRGGANLGTLNQALAYLSAGEMLLIMPEGTRSYHGRLQAAHSGVVMLALKSKAPVLPVATHGGEGYKENLKRLRRTDFYIHVGQPFTLKGAEGAVDSQSRQQMLDALMYQIAALLPPEYRGAYTRPPEAGQSYLEFG